MKSTVVLSLALVMGVATAWSGSLKWTGGAGTLNWGDAANWMATDGGGVDLTAQNDYDFTALPAGSTVVNTLALKIKSLTFAENQGTITLSGESAASTSKLIGGTWTIPAGTTVEFKLHYKDLWGETGVMTLNGAGKMRFTSSKLLAAGRYWDLNGSIEVVLGGVENAFQSAKFRLNGSSKLTLEADNVIGLINSTDSSTLTTVDLGSHVLRLRALEQSKGFAGRIIGTGKLWAYGGFKLIGGDWSDFAGLLDLGNFSLTVADMKSLGGSASLKCDDNGVLYLAGDQTLAALFGDATTGGVSVPLGKTLTVGGADGERRTFNARLTGAGGLVKTGAGSELVLGGANDYTGPTRVSAGTLTVANALRAYPKGLVNRWSFEGDADAQRYEDYGPAANHLVSLNAKPTFSSDGVGGSQCVRFDRNVHTKMTLRTAAYSHLYGTNHFTVSLWFRPEEVCAGRTLFYGPYADKQSASFYATLENPENAGLSVGGWGWCVWDKLKVNTWYHFVMTQTEKERIVYLNGARKASKTETAGWQGKQWYFEIGNYQDWNNTFQGDIDEVLTFDRALSPDEIKALYETPIPYTADASAVMPAPVAHWAFDDKDNLGKDTSGNGYDLTSEGVLESRGGGQSGIPSGGRAVQVCNDADGKRGYLHWTGSSWPAKIPQGGQSFTISVRMSSYYLTGEGGVVFAMGDMKTANRFVAVMYGASPRVCGLQFDTVNSQTPKFSTPLPVGTGYADQENSMVHQVFVWNKDTQHFSIYCDGRLVEARPEEWKATSLMVDGGTAGKILVAARDDGKAGPLAKASRFYGGIDDIQIFDKPLSQDEVRALTRQLSGISTGAALAKNSPVTVESGAKLRILTAGEEAKSLSGAGALEVAAGSSLKVSTASTFAGSVAGGGTITAGAPLTFSGDGSVFTGTVVPEGGKVTLASSFTQGTYKLPATIDTDLAGSNLPAADTAMAVEIPATGKVRISASVNDFGATSHTYVLARGAKFIGATDFSGWTVEPQNDLLRTKFFVKDGAFVLQVKSGGMVLFFR